MPTGILFEGDDHPAGGAAEEGGDAAAAANPAGEGEEEEAATGRGGATTGTSAEEEAMDALMMAAEAEADADDGDLAAVADAEGDGGREGTEVRVKVEDEEDEDAVEAAVAAATRDVMEGIAGGRGGWEEEEAAAATRDAATAAEGRDDAAGDAATEEARGASESVGVGSNLHPSRPPVPSIPPGMPRPLASKPPPKRNKSGPTYYAVRVGYAYAGPPAEGKEGDFSAIRSAIFLRWEDVRDFVEFATEGGVSARVSAAVAAAAGSQTLPFHHNVEYKQFDDIDRAERYLRRVMPGGGGKRGRKKLKEGRIVGGKVIPRKAGKTKMKRARLPHYPPAKSFNPPTKKWESMYAAALEYRAAHGNLDVPDLEEHAELVKWIKYQRTQYRYYLEDPMGGRHSITEEKANRLGEAGFEWIAGDKKTWLAELASAGDGGGTDGTARRKRGRPRKSAASVRMKTEESDARSEDAEAADGRPRNRPIRPKWLEMLEKLRRHRERTGTAEIGQDETDGDLAELRLWAKNQRNMHVRWRQGHDVGMTQEKADMLKEVGMEFPPAWEDMYVKIVQHKALHGDIEITTDHDPVLAAWMQRQNEVLGRHLQGKSTRLSDDQAMRLLGLGFQGGLRGGASAVAAIGGGSGVTGKSIASRDFEVRWDEMWAKLRDYKNEHGNCDVPTSAGTELAHWVAAQRRMYNKLISGKPGKRACLDAVKMQRLTELGFKFRPRGSYMAWDDQMKGLWKFVEENLHCRIPVNHPTLGSFVKLARRDYKNWTQGKPSSMTPERLAALKEVGFVFEGGKSPQRAAGPNKSWDERLEELLAYKSEFGHTVVPQNSGQLGAWVHSQRVHYKKYKEGQKSQMTAEKALKLTEIGFCFNASDRYRGNKRHRSHEQEQEETAMVAAAVAEQQYPYHQQQPVEQQEQHHHHYQLQETVHVPALQQQQPYLL